MNNIVSGVRKGINSLVSRANQVISGVKKAVKKNIKEEAANNIPKTNPANGGCFTVGTLVSTQDGQRPIEEVKVGDYVWSENPETGEKGLKKVANTYIHDKYTLIYIYVGDTKIETTEEHPFWVEGKGWMFAGVLNKDDVLRLKSGENIKITKLERLDLKEPVKVYNFEVEDWHTYFVSDINVLVHNKAMKYTPPAITAGKKFKTHFLDHKKILENALGTKYKKLQTDGSRFLEDIGKIINDGTVKFVGEGTINKGSVVCEIYRGNGMTVVIKPNGEFVTLLEQGKGMDLGIKFVN